MNVVVTAVNNTCSMETDDMTEAFGATSKDAEFLAPAEWINSWSVQKGFFGGAE